MESASSGGPGRAHYPPDGGPEVCGEQPVVSWPDGRLAGEPPVPARRRTQAVGVGRRRSVSTWTPGPMVDDTVILRR